MTAATDIPNADATTAAIPNAVISTATITTADANTAASTDAIATGITAIANRVIPALLLRILL